MYIWEEGLVSGCRIPIAVFIFLYVSFMFLTLIPEPSPQPSNHIVWVKLTPNLAQEETHDSDLDYQNTIILTINNVNIKFNLSQWRIWFSSFC